VNVLDMIAALRKLRLDTLASLHADAKAGQLQQSTMDAIAADLGSGASPITPAQIQAIIALIVQNLPAILALIAAILPLFGG
jgi:hypothetical protein